MRQSFAIASLTLVAVLAAGCAAPESQDLDGGDDSVRGVSADLQAKLSIGVVLRTSREANLRDSPNPQARVLRVLAVGSELIVARTSQAADGFLSVAHQGVQGWVNGNAVFFVSSPVAPAYSVVENPEPFIDMTPDPMTPGVDQDAPPPPPPQDEIPPPPPPSPTPRDDAIERAQSGVGFSYWWGGARWDPRGATSANKGSCSGVCPDCTHTGMYGADCSGYVAKVWRVPEWNSDPTKNQHPYSTYTFTNHEYEWKTIPRDQLQKADALVYNQDGKGHIMLYESGDAWGQMWTYESRACSVGIVHNLRTVPDKYKAIRHRAY
jgi:hypothetical protein